MMCCPLLERPAQLAQLCPAGALLAVLGLIEVALRDPGPYPAPLELAQLLPGPATGRGPR
jgi:hypothetical protein